MKIDTKYTKLYDYKGDIKRRWRIVFKIWDFEKDDFVRRFDYDVNKYDTQIERYRFAKKRIKEINETLSKGFALNVNKAKKVNVVSMIDEAFELKKNEYSERTTESIKSVLELFVSFLEENDKSDLQASELNKKDILEFRDSILKKGCSTRTANNYIGYVNMVFNYMVTRGGIETNPFGKIKKLKQQDSLKHREISKDERDILKPALMKDKALWLYVQFIYYCWLRPREITFLRVKNLDLANGKIFVNAAETKNKRSNFVNIPAPFLAELKRIDFPTIDNQYIFAKDGKEKMFGYEKFADNRFSVYHSKVRDKLNLSKEINLYGWKRSGVCDAYRSGVGIFDIMQHGRWQNLKEVQTYLNKSGLLLSNDIIIKMPEI
jgi:integrase